MTNAQIELLMELTEVVALHVQVRPELRAMLQELQHEAALSEAALKRFDRYVV